MTLTPDRYTNKLTHMGYTLLPFIKIVLFTSINVLIPALSVSFSKSCTFIFFYHEMFLRIKKIFVCSRIILNLLASARFLVISSYQQSYIKITNLESYFVILGFMDLVQPISIVGALLNKIYGLIFNGVIQGAIYP